MKAPTPGASNATDKAAPVRLQLRGPARLCGAGGTTWKPLSLQAAGMLCILAVEGGIGRARLRSLLWPDSGEEQAQANLRNVVRNLRNTAGSDLFEASETLTLLPTVQHDVKLPDRTDWGFDEADEKPLPNLLEDVDATAIETLHDWLEAARVRDRETRIRHWMTLALSLERRGGAAQATVLARRALSIDRLHVDALGTAMGIHARAGQRQAALDVYARARAHRMHELGTELPEGLRRMALAIECDEPPPAPVPLPGQRFGMPLQPPELLVGRENDLIAIDKAWRAGQSLMLWGESGIGKSALLNRWAHAHPGTVQVTSLLGDSQVPFALVTRLIRALLPHDHRPAADSRRAELSRLIPDLGEPPRSPAHLAIIREAFKDLCRHAHQDGVVSILVDDLQWADAVSLDFVQAAAATPDGPFWLLARHPPPSEETLVGAVPPAAPTPWPVHRLLPLSANDLAQWLRELSVPDRWVMAWAEWLNQATLGSPRHMVELLQSLPTELPNGFADGPPKPDALPMQWQSITALIHARLGALPVPLRDLLHLTALAGPLMSVDLALDLLKLSPFDYARQCQALAAQGLLTDTRLAHDGLRQPLLKGAPPSVAKSLHARIAQHADRRGRPSTSHQDSVDTSTAGTTPAPSLVALHWRLAGQSAKAAHNFELAAEQAQTLNDLAATLRFWDDAHHTWLQAFNAAKAFNAALKAAQVSLSVEPYAQSMSRANRLQTLGQGERQRSEAALIMAQCHLTIYAWQDGLLQTERAVELSRSAVGHDSDSRALHLRAWSCKVFALSGLGRHDEARAEGNLLKLELNDTMPDRLVMDCLSVLGNAQLFGHQTREAGASMRKALTLADRMGDAAESMVLCGNLALVHTYLGQTRDLCNAGLAALAHHRRLGQGHSVSGLSTVLACASGLMRVARWGEGYALLEEYLPLFRAQGMPERLGILLSNRLQMWFELGQVELARADWQEAQGLPGANASALLAMRERQLRRLTGAPWQTEWDDTPDAVIARCAGSTHLARTLLHLHLLPEYPASEAVVRARAIAEDARRTEFPSAEAAALLGEAAALSRLGDHPHAAALARQVADRLESVRPMVHNDASVWHTTWQCHLQAGQHEQASNALERGLAAVLDDGLPNVPAEFREGYLRVNPVHRELLQAGGPKQPN